MNVNKFLEHKISTITILTGLAYVAYISIRFGESVYFGYPVDFIWTDINSLLIALMKNSLIILALSWVIYKSIISGSGFISNLASLVGGVLGTSLWNVKIFIGSFSGVAIMVLIFLLIFASASLIKKITSKADSGSNLVLAFIMYVIMCILIGNWWSSILPVLINEKDEIIVANYKDKIIKIGCHNGVKKVSLSTLGDIEIKTTTHPNLKRDGFGSNCNDI